MQNQMKRLSLRKISVLCFEKVFGRGFRDVRKGSRAAGPLSRSHSMVELVDSLLQPQDAVSHSQD